MKLNYPSRAENIVPYNDVALLMDMGKLKEEIGKLEPTRKQRLIALLASVYPSSKLSEMTGVKRSYIHYACKKFRDIVEAAQLGRNISIAGVAERQVLRIMLGMNPEKMHEDKKAQSARSLMEVAELAMVQTKPKEKEDDTDTVSLIFKIKQRMKPKEVEQDAPIDITDQVTVTDVIEEKNETNDSLPKLQ